MTSKQRAYLKGLAMNIEPVLQIGKACLTPEVTEAVRPLPRWYRSLGKKLCCIRKIKTSKKLSFLNREARRDGYGKENWHYGRNF